MDHHLWFLFDLLGQSLWSSAPVGSLRLPDVAFMDLPTWPWQTVQQRKLNDLLGHFLWRMKRVGHSCSSMVLQTMPQYMWIGTEKRRVASSWSAMMIDKTGSALRSRICFLEIKDHQDPWLKPIKKIEESSLGVRLILSWHCDEPRVGIYTQPLN